VLVNYFDRINISVSHAALITTFAISNVTFGYLSAAFNWSYALCQLPVGVVLDKFGVRKIGRISTLVWSAASFGAAIAPNLTGLFAARLLLGVGEAPSFPANAKATGNWFPSKERSFATSFFDGAGKFAPAIGVPLIGMLLIRVGWRWSFVATGALSLLYFFLFYRVYREPEEDAGLSAEERDYILAEHRAASATASSLSGTAPLGYLLRQKKILGLALGFGAYNYIFYLLLTWLPSYLSYSLNLNLADSFLYTGVPWLIGTVTDIFIGGWLLDRLIARGWDANRLRRTILIGGTTLGLGIVGTAFVHSAAGALAWISISIGGLSAAAPVGWSIPSLIAPRNSVGSVGGILNFSNQISGMLAPIVTGYVVTAMHSFAWAFVISAAYLVIGIWAYIFLLGRIEPIKIEA
jgi:MFS transporter, ACS family, D-galactonate transporter